MTVAANSSVCVDKKSNPLRPNSSHSHAQRPDGSSVHGNDKAAQSGDERMSNSHYWMWKGCVGEYWIQDISQASNAIEFDELSGFSSTPYGNL